MIIVLKSGIGDRDVDDICRRVIEMGYAPHVIRGEFKTIVAAVGEERGRPDRLVISLDAGEIRFSPLTGSQGEGISRVEFAAVDTPAMVEAAVALGLPSGPSWVRAGGVDLELATSGDERPAGRGP